MAAARRMIEASRAEIVSGARMYTDDEVRAYVADLDEQDRESFRSAATLPSNYTATPPAPILSGPGWARHTLGACTLDDGTVVRPMLFIRDGVVRGGFQFERYNVARPFYRIRAERRSAEGRLLGSWESENVTTENCSALTVHAIHWVEAGAPLVEPARAP